MSSELDEINAFINGGSGRSAFPEGTGIGVRVKGKIVEAKMADRTDPKTKEVKRFPDGSPQRQLVVTVDTGQPDGPDDDGLRRFYFSGLSAEAQRPTEGDGTSGQQAIRDALSKHGAKWPEIGGELEVLRSGIGTKAKGQSAPFLYKARYEPPTNSVDGW